MIALVQPSHAVVAGGYRLGRQTLMARRRSGSSATKPKRRHNPVAGARVLRPQTGHGTGPAGVAPQAAEAVEPEALVVTYLFDSGDEDEPYDATVRITGRRVGASNIPRTGDTFSKDETIEGVVPGTGPVSLTAGVYGLKPGEWMVYAHLVRDPGGSRGAARPRSRGVTPIKPATWSWRRWALSAAEARPVKTRWALLAPLATQPAVIPGVYTALAIVGFVLALALQAAVLAGRGVPVGSPLAASLIALLAGLLGAKAWYVVLHPDESVIRGGWAVDGFLIVAPLVAALTLFAWELPIGVVLDATTPGIFFAVALGRVGCFVTGCCAGRCTASRWGIWSSDRRVGARRVPTQLIESLAGLALGVVSLVVVGAGGFPVHGAVFVGAFVLYALVRQVLLRLRAERRKVRRTIPLTAAAAGLVALVVAVLSLAQGA